MSDRPLLLSIITPTYNRGHLLKNCYDSLKAQTDSRFEWIIVDDGSNDSTKEVVESFLADDIGMKITYVSKANGGKHTALNASHPHIHGDYVLILDSDDTLTEDAVSRVFGGWEEFRDQTEIGIVTFLKGSSVSEPNAYVRDEKTPVDILCYKRVCVRSSDCCEVIRTELFLKYPFPVFEGERFLSECALWNRVGITHKCVYINKVIYICEYLEGGLTDSGRTLRGRNPLGGMYTSRLRMQKKNHRSQRIKYGLLYVCYGFLARQKPIQIIAQNPYKALTVICLFPGFIISIIWKKRYY